MPGDSTGDQRPPVRAEMTSDPRYLSAVRALVGQFAARCGFNEHQCGQIALAVDEAICNIINHGYQRREDGRIWIHLWPLQEPRGVKIVLEDEARQVDLETIRSRDLDDIRPGGLGVHIIREIMDEVEYAHREVRGMRLTMAKTLLQPPRGRNGTEG